MRSATQSSSARPLGSQITPTCELPRVLCVDDEPRVLDGLTRTFHRVYDVTTAQSGEEGLEIIHTQKPFAVVVSDMRMPAMDGATFLSGVRLADPDIVRILLTGYADFDTAFAAVNDGYIFRLLTKPCPPQKLLSALQHAVVQYRLVTRDRKLLVQKLDEMASELLQADRLATVETVARGVGHELNNIAQVLMLLLPSLKKRLQRQRPPTEEHLAEIRSIIESLTTHGDHMMRLGRPEERKREDLRTIVSETVTMLQTAGRLKQIRVAVGLPSEAALVDVERVRTEQVLVNLLGNAADAVAQSDGAMQIRIEVGVEAGRVFCRVTDTGCGMSPDTQAKIFEPYFTTKECNCGTGLGLPVVRQIIESYGGTISVESEVDRGSTFTLYLPLAS